MQIRIKKVWGGEGRVDSVEWYVVEQINRTSDDSVGHGTLERTEDRVDRLANSFASLMGHLVSRGVVEPGNLPDLMGDYGHEITGVTNE